MSGPTRKQLVERWEDACTPEMLLAPSPFGLVDGREDFRGYHWQGKLGDYGMPAEGFLPEGQVIDNVDLSYAEINPFQARHLTLSNCYAKQAKILVASWTHGSVTACEFERCTVKDGMPWLGVTVADCVFRACKFPEVFAWGARYDNCQAIDMRLKGPVGGGLNNPVLTNVTVSGKWKECSLEETVEGDQLVGCDFSEVEFGIAGFDYVDMHKVKIPAELQRLTVLNWEDIRGRVVELVGELRESSSQGEEALTQSSLALEYMEIDFRGQHDEAPRPRGARYCLELDAWAGWGHSHNYLLELYRDAGAEFMRDPFEESED